MSEMPHKDSEIGVFMSKICLFITVKRILIIRPINALFSTFSDHNFFFFFFLFSFFNFI